MTEAQAAELIVILSAIRNNLTAIFVFVGLIAFILTVKGK